MGVWLGLTAFPEPLESYFLGAPSTYIQVPSDETKVKSDFLRVNLGERHGPDPLWAFCLPPMEVYFLL